MTEVEKAQEVLADLQGQRDVLVARGHELEEQRQAIAFKAHTGSKAERAKLDEINNEALTHEYELKSLDSAIAEATRQLAAADAAQALAQEKANAKALRAVVDRFVAHALKIDETFTAMVKEATALEKTLMEIHSLGCAFPSRAQLDSLGARALGTAIMGTPWRKDFEHLAPSARQYFPTLVRQWCERIEANHIAPKIGDLKIKEVA
jgi:hypothetical protein